MSKTFFGEQDDQIANPDNELSIEERRKKLEEKENEDILAVTAKLESLKAEKADAKEISSTEKWLEYLKDKKEMPERVARREVEEAKRLGQEMEAKGKNISNKSTSSVMGRAARAAFLSAVALTSSGLVAKSSAAEKKSKEPILQEAVVETKEKNITEDKEAKIKAELKAELAPKVRAELEKAKAKKEAIDKKAQEKAVKAKIKKEAAEKKAQEKLAEKEKEKILEIYKANVKAKTEVEADRVKAEKAREKMEAKAKIQAQKDMEVVEAIEQGRNRIFIYNDSSKFLFVKEVRGPRNIKEIMELGPGVTANLTYHHDGANIIVETHKKFFNTTTFREHVVFSGGGPQAMVFNGERAGKVKLEQIPYLRKILSQKDRIYNLANNFDANANIDIRKEKVDEENVDKTTDLNKNNQEEKAVPEKEVAAPEKEKTIIQQDVVMKSESNKVEEKVDDLIIINRANAGTDFLSFKDGSSITIRDNNGGGYKVEIKYTGHPEDAAAIRNILVDDYFEILKKGRNAQELSSAINSVGVVANDVFFMNKVIAKLAEQNAKDPAIGKLKNHVEFEKKQAFDKYGVQVFK